MSILSQKIRLDFCFSQSAKCLYRCWVYRDFQGTGPVWLIVSQADVGDDRHVAATATTTGEQSVDNHDLVVKRLEFTLGLTRGP
jgi:hypothetical protein